MTKKLKKFTVRRSKWCRAGKNGASKLLNHRGAMCCLGFACNQISRIPKDKLLHCVSPEDILERPSFLTEWDTEYKDDVPLDERDIVDNILAVLAIKINDDENITDKLREQRLTKLFRKYRVIVTFKD